MAVMLLAVGFINWLSRLEDPLGAIESGGLYLSLLGAVVVSMAGWLGGELVFEHHVGLGKHNDEDGADEQHEHTDHQGRLPVLFFRAGQGPEHAKGRPDAWGGSGRQGFSAVLHVRENRRWRVRKPWWLREVFFAFS